MTKGDRKKLMDAVELIAKATPLVDEVYSSYEDRVDNAKEGTEKHDQLQEVCDRLAEAKEGLDSAADALNDVTFEEGQ